MSRENVKVDQRVLHAADNNARWCEIVCRSHGLPTRMDGRIWAAPQGSPELYPDAVTLRPDAAVEDVLEAVQGGPGCSVKDSFSALELGNEGFSELFRARWFFREAAPPPSDRARGWTVVETHEGFEEWARAAGLSGILRTDLLHDPSVRVLAAFGPAGLDAGAVANRTGSVVGVSNVFTTTISAEEAWAGLAKTLAVIFPSLPFVGYERGHDLEAARAGGFTELGDLRVWLSEQGAHAD